MHVCILYNVSKVKTRVQCTIFLFSWLLCCWEKKKRKWLVVKWTKRKNSSIRRRWWDDEYFEQRCMENQANRIKKGLSLSRSVKCVLYCVSEQSFWIYELLAFYFNDQSRQDRKTVQVNGKKIEFWEEDNNKKQNWWCWWWRETTANLLLNKTSVLSCYMFGLIAQKACSYANLKKMSVQLWPGHYLDKGIRKNHDNNDYLYCWTRSSTHHCHPNDYMMMMTLVHTGYIIVFSFGSAFLVIVIIII